MNEEPRTPTDSVADWIATHQHEIGGPPITFNRREEHSRALNAGFDTPKFLIDICAWDHACCLDMLERHASKDEYWHFDYVDILAFRYVVKGKWYFLVEFGALSEKSGDFVKARIPVNMSGGAAELFQVHEPIKPTSPKP